MDRYRKQRRAKARGEFTTAKQRAEAAKKLVEKFEKKPDRRKSL